MLQSLLDAPLVSRTLTRLQIVVSETQIVAVVDTDYSTNFSVRQSVSYHLLDEPYSLMSPSCRYESNERIDHELRGRPGLVKRTPFKFQPLIQAVSEVAIDSDLPEVSSHRLVPAICDVGRGEDPCIHLHHLLVDFQAPGFELRQIVIIKLLTPLAN